MFVEAGHWSLLVDFRSFRQQIHRKIVDFSGIRTRIARVEGEQSDHGHCPSKLGGVHSQEPKHLPATH